MWLYIGSLFIITMLIGWFGFNHELDFERLHNIPYNPNFNIMHFIAPILLIALTCNKVPVSTTFLILSVFSTQDILGFMLIKTFAGYILSFIFSFLSWSFLHKFFKKFFEDKSEIRIKKWRIFQWASSGALWVAWLIQNTSNMVVYIPREITAYELILIIVLGLIMVGFTIYNRGGPIQEIVEEKTDIKNIHSTSMINLNLAIMILIMTYIGTIPIATTWIFIGILGGRELAITLNGDNQLLSIKDRNRKAIKSILKDLALAGFGIVVSLIFYFINTLF